MTGLEKTLIMCWNSFWTQQMLIMPLIILYIYLWTIAIAVPYKIINKVKKNIDKLLSTDGVKNTCWKKRTNLTPIMRKIQPKEIIKKHANYLISMQIKSERLCYANELEQTKLDNGKTWIVPNSIICRCKSNASNTSDTFWRHCKYYEPKAIANAINNYFADIDHSISSNTSFVVRSIYDYLIKRFVKSTSTTESEFVPVVSKLSFNSLLIILA